MIIMTKEGDILKGHEKRIAFAVNTEGLNETGFSGVICNNFWPELSELGETKIGTVLTKKINGIEFFALCCLSLKQGWFNQQEIIKQCFDDIPGSEPVATVSIGAGIIGMLSGADHQSIHSGMEESEKEIILYEKRILVKD